MVLIDKPIGMTSHQVVSAVRKILQMDKVGHLGTLDPFASGLLPILIGGATRLSDEILGSQKQYLFTIKLGMETDTLDLHGQIVNEKSVPVDFEEKIRHVLPQFHGEIAQIPPVYSALKMQGKPLYAYMRAVGQLPCAIETKKRNIQIQSLEIIHSDQDKSEITLRALCGKGTYIRSLARDLAYAIGTVGFCNALRREFLEPDWHVNNAVVFLQENKPSADDLLSNLISPQTILPNIPHFVLSEIHTKFLLSGNVCFVDKTELVLEKEPMESSYVFITSKNNEVMYYGTMEDIQNERIKICPKKKMY
jgi:tRNA pseudouridine55 synthase